jgi:hypothetical protein
MRWIVANIKWLMLVSGAMTCTMLSAAIAPQAALRSNFGEALAGSVSEIVVRNWGALIGLIGLMLIYAANRPATRALVLTVAGISKLTFITLVLVYGQQYLGEPVGVAVAIDAVWVILFVGYFIGVRNAPSVETTVRGV